VIKLVITDAVQAHRRIRCDHEIECGACRPAINERCWEPAGRDLLVTDEAHPHESTRGVGLQFEELANLVCCQIFNHTFLLKIKRRTSNVQRRIVRMNSEDRTADAKDRTGVIDVIAEDPKTGEVVLVMNEADEWNGSDEQLLALQERFNAYVSFLLDGEMATDHPDLAGKSARIELRCAHMPDARALELLALIHDQLAFQEIKLEVVVRGKESMTKFE
jgi:hypothetical protein